MSIVIEGKARASERTAAAKKPLTKWQKIEQRYYDELPGTLGFFTLATPVALIADAWRHIPPANAGITRLLLTSIGLAGMQPIIGGVRKALYDATNIYHRGEGAKRTFDMAYGALAGALLNPAFHKLTSSLPFLHLNESVAYQDSALAGAVVGAVTGLVGWLASDAYSHTWNIENTPSRTIGIPGANYVKHLPTRTKKLIAGGAALLSFGAATAHYTSNHYSNQTNQGYSSVPRTHISASNGALENKVSN